MARFAKHKLLIALIGALIAAAAAIGTAVLVEYYQNKRETENAKALVSATLSNASYEVGAFLTTATLHPASIDKSYEQHESKMNELMPPVRVAMAQLAARDPEATQRFEGIVREISDIDGCFTRIYRGMHAGPRREFAIDGLRVTYLSVTADLPTTLATISRGGFENNPYRSACNVPVDQ